MCWENENLIQYFGQVFYFGTIQISISLTWQPIILSKQLNPKFWPQRIKKLSSSEKNVLSELYVKLFSIFYFYWLLPEYSELASLSDFTMG